MRPPFVSPSQQSQPIRALPADASSSSSTAPSSPAETSDPSSCQSDAYPSSTKNVDSCASSDSVAHHEDSQAASVAGSASNDKSAQTPSRTTVLDKYPHNATGEKRKGAISITPSRNTLTFFPPLSKEHTHPDATTVNNSSARVGLTTCFTPTYTAVPAARKPSSESINCMSDFVPTTEFRAGGELSDVSPRINR